MAQNQNQKEEGGFEDLPDDVLDDLADDLDLEAYDTEALSDENWDEEPVASSTKSTPKKKKSSLFNLIVIVIGVLVFLAFVYMKATSGPASQPVAQAPVSSSSAPVVDNTVQPPADMPDVAGGSGDVATVPAAPVNDPLTPMPDFNAPSTGVAVPSSETPSVPSAPTPLPAESPSAVSVEEPQPIAPIVPAVAPMTASVTPVPPPVVSMESPVKTSDSTAPVSSQAPALTPDVPDERLKSIEDQLASLTRLMQQNQKQGEDMAVVAKALENLNTRLSSLEKRTANRPERVSDEVSGHIENPPPSRTKQARPAPSSDVPRLSQKKIQEKPVSEVDEPIARPITPVAPRLTLRAVSNGIAYVARVGSNDLVPVAVGQPMPGIGQVVSIAQESGRWVVRGTTGQLTQ